MDRIGGVFLLAVSITSGGLCAGIGQALIVYQLTGRLLGPLETVGVAFIAAPTMVLTLLILAVAAFVAGIRQIGGR